ncbi:serine/arginine-rich splicing factor 3-like isoform X4 [Ixodes scapularis]
MIKAKAPSCFTSSASLTTVGQTMEWSLDCKVYVGNLGSGAAKHEIEAAFTKFGPLRNVWVARNPPGFAFVEFEDSRDAEDACRALDGSRLCGTRVRVEMSHGRSRRGGASRRPAPAPPRSRSPRRRYSRSRSRSRSRSLRRSTGSRSLSRERR